MSYQCFQFLIVFRVLVLDDGKVLEFDDLQNLKGNEKSHFGKMLMKSDEIQASLK